MALPILALNARLNETTSFMQEGTGFVMGSPPTLTVTDQSANPYTFTVSLVEVISASRLRVTVTCSAVPATKAPKTSIVVALTAGSGTISTDAVPIVLRTHHEPILNLNTQLTRQHLDPTVGNKSVVFLPVSGMGDLITPIYTPGSTPLLGSWTLHSATQLKSSPRVKITLICVTAPPKVKDNAPPTSTLAVTLVGEDGTTTDVPPVTVTYGADPEEAPDA